MVPRAPGLHERLEPWIGDDTERAKAFGDPLRNLNARLGASMLVRAVRDLTCLARKVGGDGAILEDTPNDLLARLGDVRCGTRSVDGLFTPAFDSMTAHVRCRVVVLGVEEPTDFGFAAVPDAVEHVRAAAAHILDGRVGL